MRKMKSLFIPIFALLLSTAAFAGNGIDGIENANENLRNEIAKKFMHMDIDRLNLKDNSVKVEFMINEENELIVLRTDNPELDYIVKARLNYKEVETTDLKKTHLYSISIKLMAG